MGVKLKKDGGGKISIYTPQYLFSGSSHFSNSPKGFEEFEKWLVPLFG